MAIARCTSETAHAVFNDSFLSIRLLRPRPIDCPDAVRILYVADGAGTFRGNRSNSQIDKFHLFLPITKKHHVVPAALPMCTPPTPELSARIRSRHVVRRHY